MVVMEYIIGSNLEDARGCASVNIAQMLEATKKGNGLDFVVQAGGCDRWFTEGIDDATVGRYLISGGKLETAQMLDDGMCLSEPQNLTDFIVWTRDNYPADRYMLVLWDHGGGFASGYGSDDLNDREDEEMTMSASEIIGAVREADTKFDVIGFDACLMQNVEFAYAFEPYADYYLASEESEPGTGWFYTAGFGKLAEDPTLDTAEFGKSMITSYDQSNRATNNGEPQHDFTLSLVDLTLIKPVYEQLTDIYKMASHEMTENRIVFSVMSAARSRAYEFGDDEQVDLVSFLMNLKNADYEEQVLTDEEIDRIAQTAKACVVYRNSDAAEGTNGISIDFPYDDLYIYSEEHKQLKAVKYTTEQDFFDRFCSIMASQQKKKHADDDSLWGLLSLIDYSEEEWYIEGFEDYDTADLFIDIPVIELDDGFLPELPDKTWASILDCTVAAYLETEEGMMYIGQEHFADEDDEGHPIVYMDGRWAHVAGTPVCYETEDPLVTEDGIVYRGTAKAILNETEHVTLHIEWEPLKEDGDESKLKGKVTGYTLDDEEGFSFMKKGLEQFDTGDTIDFVFDFYDENGELIKTGTYGNRLHIISEDYLVVKDEEFPSGTRVQFFGVLTDVFQRQMITEELYAVVQ